MNVLVLVLALAGVETTIGERIPVDFATLIDAPDVAVKGGGTFPPSAVVCGACHQDQLRQWRGSTHANALDDLQFLAELAKQIVVVLGESYRHGQCDYQGSCGRHEQFWEMWNHNEPLVRGERVSRRLS